MKIWEINVNYMKKFEEFGELGSRAHGNLGVLGMGGPILGGSGIRLGLIGIRGIRGLWEFELRDLGDKGGRIRAYSLGPTRIWI